MKRRRAERGGRRAETIAAWWLRLKGWTILARRVRTPVGEVDLVARRGRVTAFIEVKARAGAAEAPRSRSTNIGCAASSPPRKHWRIVTRAPAATSGSTPCSSCPGDCRVTSPTSRKDDGLQSEIEIPGRQFFGNHWLVRA